MIPEELDAIEARADAATAGPWTACDAGGGCPCGVVWAPDDETAITESEAGDVVRSGKQRAADAAFIAAARTDIPALVAAVRAAEERAERAEPDRELLREVARRAWHNGRNSLEGLPYESPERIAYGHRLADAIVESVLSARRKP